MRTWWPIVVAVAFACCANSAVFAKPTNIVLIYVDNQGYGDVGCYGNQGVKTPRIDKLASDGVRATQFARSLNRR